jgi:hypothetical protein
MKTYCYSNNGLSMRLVPADYQAQDGETTSAAPLTDEALAKLFPAHAAAAAQENIRLKILELEAQQTPRRLREAALGTDDGWLQNLNEAIAALRAQIAP